MDAWGNAIVYINPGTHNEYMYDVYSLGPDGQGDGTERDDINNW